MQYCPVSLAPCWWGTSSWYLQSHSRYTTIILRPTPTGGNLSVINISRNNWQYFRLCIYVIIRLRKILLCFQLWCRIKSLAGVAASETESQTVVYSAVSRPKLAWTFPLMDSVLQLAFITSPCQPSQHHKISQHGAQLYLWCLIFSLNVKTLNSVSCNLIKTFIIIHFIQILWQLNYFNWII